jgi:hypothetical protein
MGINESQGANTVGKTSSFQDPTLDLLNAESYNDVLNARNNLNFGAFGANTNPYSSFASMFGLGGNNRAGGMFGSLPGYVLGGLSYLDQKKTNDLNRKATQYALDRKRKEDKDYDNYRNTWSHLSFGG